MKMYPYKYRRVVKIVATYEFIFTLAVAAIVICGFIAYISCNGNDGTKAILLQGFDQFAPGFGTETFVLVGRSFVVIVLLHMNGLAAMDLLKATKFGIHPKDALDGVEYYSGGSCLFLIIAGIGYAMTSKFIILISLFAVKAAFWYVVENYTKELELEAYKAAIGNIRIVPHVEKV